MLLMALLRLESQDESLRDSRSQISFAEKDCRKEECPRVSLTPLALRIVS